MNTKKIFYNNKFSVVSFVLFMLISTRVTAGAVPTIPEIPAFLPTVDSVPASQAMPLDGTWLITGLGKKVRIEAGRAYAVDSWLHLFVLRISPGMVVIKNISPTAAGQYSGDDLPLIGKWVAKVQANRSLAVSVATTMGPIPYVMVPVQLDNPGWYAQEMEAAGFAVQAPVVQPDPPIYQPTPPPTYQPNPPDYQPTPPTDGGGYDDEDEYEYDDDDEYEDEGGEPVAIDDDPQEEEKPKAVKKEIKAKDHGAYACKGKNLYYSKGSCYSCPKGYSRFSPTRKMTHAKACTKRQPGKNAYAKAKYISKFSLSCPKPQFKHSGRCKSCPTGYESKRAPEVSTGALFHTGYCIAK